jgi:hypothetical protein
MATILELAKPPEQKLLKLDALLEAKEQEFRRIYLSCRTRDKMATEVPMWGSQHNISVMPLDQFSALASRFVSGSELVFDHDFKSLHRYENGLRNYDDGVWELKTADVRMFGWFCKMDWFVAVAVDEAWRVKHHNLYGGYRDAVIRFRAELDLDNPKFIPGGDPVNVVSNFYPA